jgi:hypothetical protein
MDFQSGGMAFLGGDLSGGSSSGGPALQFSVPCLEVVDQEGKPPSFNYLFYELPLPEFPFKVDFYVANGWCNGKGKFVQSMSILKPDKTTMVETGDQPFELKEAITPFMAVNFFQGIVFEQPGTYWFRVNLAGRKVLEYPLTVREAAKK